MTAIAVHARPLSVWRWMRRNQLLALGLVTLGIVVLAGLLAPLITPAPGDVGNATHPNQSLLPP
jgi:hypothetical protein